MAAVEGTGLGGESGDQSMALVGGTRATFGGGGVGVLDGCGLAGYERVLAVVDGVGEGVGEAQVSPASYAAIDGECGAVVDAGRGALELVNGAQLRDGPAQWIDAGREGAGEGLGELPSREGVDCVESAGAGTCRIEDRVVEGDGLREIDVQGTDEMFAMDVEIGERDGSVVSDFFFESDAGLLDSRSDEVGGEGGNVAGDTLGESAWAARSWQRRAGS